MKPVLVIMAAGMGSRFGGLKQITPVDDAGHILMDYSIFDAMRAGFGRVVLIIKPELEADFTNLILSRLSGEVQVDFAYQTPDRLPEGFSVPEGRVKPWGTAHAVLCAREKIDAPFCVINADDFYGRTSFESIAQFLTTEASLSAHAMVGYRIENTLTENGHVARGICQTDEHSMLISVTELHLRAGRHLCEHEHVGLPHRHSGRNRRAFCPLAAGKPAREPPQVRILPAADSQPAA